MSDTFMNLVYTGGILAVIVLLISIVRSDRKMDKQIKQLQDLADAIERRNLDRGRRYFDSVEKRNEQD